MREFISESHRGLEGQNTCWA